MEFLWLGVYYVIREWRRDFSREVILGKRDSHEGAQTRNVKPQPREPASVEILNFADRPWANDGGPQQQAEPQPHFERALGRNAGQIRPRGNTAFPCAHAAVAVREEPPLGEDIGQQFPR